MKRPGGRRSSRIEEASTSPLARSPHRRSAAVRTARHLVARAAHVIRVGDHLGVVVSREPSSTTMTSRRPLAARAGCCRAPRRVRRRVVRRTTTSTKRFRRAFVAGRCACLPPARASRCSGRSALRAVNFFRMSPVRAAHRVVEAHAAMFGRDARQHLVVLVRVTAAALTAVVLLEVLLGEAARPDLVDQRGPSSCSRSSRH